MTASTPSAAQLASVSGIGDAARGLLRDGISSKELTEAVIAAGHFADAVRLIAFALPKRESVWWAWVCARRAAAPTPGIQASLAATEKWIAQPTDDNRRAAMAAAQAAGVDTAAGCAGFAAFLCGPTLGPPNAQPVPPGPFDSAKAVAGAVTMAAVAVPEKIEENFRTFLQQGMEVTARIKLW